MFSLLTTCYLFLGGAGAGTLVVLCVLELTRAMGWRGFEVPDELFVRTWPVGAVLLALGVVCLLADVGRPDRLLAFVVSPVPTALTVGAYALALSLVVACAFSAFALFDGRRPPTSVVLGLALVGVVGGLVTATYTGVLLQSLASVLFWQTPLLPVAFVLSSMSCGVGCVFLGAAFVEARRPFVQALARLSCIDGALIALEAATLAAYLIFAWNDEGRASAAEALVFGEVACLFWGGLVVCGLVIPFVLERFLSFGNARVQLLWIAAFLMVGGFSLRLCIVEAGAYDVTQMAGALYGLGLS